jgi:anti-sigma regulatory factor (Ser/Thr protein kinase)
MGAHLMVTSSLRDALSVILQASLPGVQSLRLAPHPTAPRAARTFVSRTLLDWRLSQHIATSTLVVSELVTNAMTHAATDIDLTLTEHRQGIRIAVRDQSPELPVERPGTSGEHGRGLTIVASLSSAWGVFPHKDGGKVVWAVLDARPRAPQMDGRRGTTAAVALLRLPRRRAHESVPPGSVSW